jgi:hypothetical protein
MRVNLNGGFYLEASQPAKHDGEEDAKWWCVTLEHAEVDTEMDQLACSVHAFGTAKNAIETAVAELANDPLYYYLDGADRSKMLVPESVKRRYYKA